MIGIITHTAHPFSDSIPCWCWSGHSGFHIGVQTNWKSQCYDHLVFPAMLQKLQWIQNKEQLDLTWLEIVNNIQSHLPPGDDVWVKSNNKNHKSISLPFTFIPTHFGAKSVIFFYRNPNIIWKYVLYTSSYQDMLRPRTQCRPPPKWFSAGWPIQWPSGPVWGGGLESANMKYRTRRSWVRIPPVISSRKVFHPGRKLNRLLPSKPVYFLWALRQLEPHQLPAANLLPVQNAFTGWSANESSKQTNKNFTDWLSRTKHSVSNPA